MKSNTAVSTFKNRALIVAVCYVTVFMLGIYLAFFQYTVLNITQKFNLSSGMIGLFVAMQSIGMTISPFLLGVMSGKNGKKKTVLLSYAFIIIGLALAGCSSHISMYICAVLLIGAGYSVTEATLTATLSDEFSSRSTMHLNFSQVCFSLGAFFGPFIAKWLIEKISIYFQNLYFFMAVPFLILLILFVFTRHFNDNIAAQEVKTFSVFKKLGNRAILFLIISIFLYVGLENTAANFTDSYFELELSMPQLSAKALSFFWLAMVPSRLLAGLLMKNTKSLFAGLSIAMIISFILAMVIKNPSVKLAMFAVCGFACGPIWPLVVDRLAKKSKGYTAPMLNIAFAFCGLGATLLPLAAGFLVNAATQSYVYYLCAAASVLMLISFFASQSKASNKLLRN